ncbi:hypothetical protein AVEN_264037-1 [Araneus ventricosus]|uniref:Uncharacterized protein n=1 Tax=Araneus ventricosus TaxID=182803 RepID=A0A4Y2PXJ9_ARAVE|nr:hypothetical protein AVEN_264037-1 [Araneus ventricosus]
MGKAAHLSEFDRGQIVMAQRLGTSITETARLVGCSRSAVVSIQEKWINDGDTSSRRQDVGRPRVIRERGRRRLSRLVNGPGNIETGPWMSGRELPGRMNPDFSFITSMVVSGYAVCQANIFSPLVQQVIHRLVVAVLCFGGLLMGGSGTRSCYTADHESCELSEHHCVSVAPLHGVCLPSWKWNLPAGQRLLSQGSDCVGVFPGTY